MTYIIESIRTHGGTPTDREARRKGQRVEILNLNVGQALLLVYRDDHNKILQTSRVESIAGYDVLTVKTANSVYTFRKGGVSPGGSIGHEPK
ncbi:hypothetical protein [Paenibacillus tuaregi]|uniref:hypothetical protein n=1 Tax=Paenibacillus tuaregi TaxID=1816681 RepID=UPI0012FD01EC|nr:hypothetical protein [Paenibacillus tuaregi]